MSWVVVYIYIYILARRFPCLLLCGAVPNDALRRWGRAGCGRSRRSSEVGKR